MRRAKVAPLRQDHALQASILRIASVELSYPRDTGVRSGNAGLALGACQACRFQAGTATESAHCFVVLEALCNPSAAPPRRQITTNGQPENSA